MLGLTLREEFRGMVMIELSNDFVGIGIAKILVENDSIVQNFQSKTIREILFKTRGSRGELTSCRQTRSLVKHYRLDTLKNS